MNFQKVEIPSNSELRTIDEYAFAMCSIVIIEIPPKVTKIYSYAFTRCTKLRRFMIPSNSELKIIEKNAFLDSSVENISIPASLIELKEGWCSFTNKLIHVEIDPRNKHYCSSPDGKIIFGK